MNDLTDNASQSHSSLIELGQKAKAISKDERKRILENFRETDLHGYLKELLKAMQPNYVIEVTHGNDELGKDLVIVRRDTITVDVIAVVVKRGNIRAKTLGEVDDTIGKVNSILTASDGTAVAPQVQSISPPIHVCHRHRE